MGVICKVDAIDFSISGEFGRGRGCGVTGTSKRGRKGEERKKEKKVGEQKGKSKIGLSKLSFRQYGRGAR
jgi:hypothetical protein